MCCLHTNGADTGGFEGCYTCVAKVIEDLVTDDATCESLATTVSAVIRPQLYYALTSHLHACCCSSLSYLLETHYQTICEDIYACFVGDDAQCAGAACVTELTAYGECPQEEECPDLCPSLEHVGLNLASMIA